MIESRHQGATPFLIKDSVESDLLTKIAQSRYSPLVAYFQMRLAGAISHVNR
jgi:hypothetical protein